MNSVSNKSSKSLLFIFGPASLIAIIALGIYVWDRGAFPGFRPKIVPVGIEDINYNDYRGVKIEGMARYDIRIKQSLPDGKTYMVFPVVPLDKPNSKFIDVMVRSTKIPEGIYGMEEVVIEGFVRPPGRLINKEIMLAWMDEGYIFDNHFVLIEAYDD